MTIGILIFWLLFCFVVGVIADRRGRAGFGWLLLSIFISPVLGLILVLALPEPQGEIKIDRREYE